MPYGPTRFVNGQNQAGAPVNTQVQGGDIKVIFPDAFYAGDPNPEVQKFIGAYKQQYGEDPDYLAAQGYTVFRIMARVAESPQTLSREALPQQLQNLTGVPGLPWFQKFNAQREEETVLYLLTITGGSIQMVPPIARTSRRAMATAARVEM